MNVDAVVQILVAHAPYAIRFAVGLYIVYQDWKADRDLARQERLATLERLEGLTIAMNDLTHQIEELRRQLGQKGQEGP